MLDEMYQAGHSDQLDDLLKKFLENKAVTSTDDEFQKPESPRFALGAAGKPPRAVPPGRDSGILLEQSLAGNSHWMNV